MQSSFGVSIFLRTLDKLKPVCTARQYKCINIHCNYSSIQMKCQGGNKYALSITVKFDQSTKRFGRIGCARLFKFTKHIALLFYLLSPYLLSCMRGSRNIRTDMHIIKAIMKFCAHWSTVCVWRSPTPVGFEPSKPGLCCASEAHI